MSWIITSLNHAHPWHVKLVKVQVISSPELSNSSIYTVIYKVLLAFFVFSHKRNKYPWHQFLQEISHASSFLAKKHDHLLLRELLVSMGRHPSLVGFSSPWLRVLGLQGTQQGRCSLSAILQLGYLTKARTCVQAEWCPLVHSFVTPGTSAACAMLPHTAISLLSPSLSPSTWVSLPGAQLQEPGDLNQLLSGNLHSSTIHRELQTVCHPKNIHRQLHTAGFHWP